MAAEFAAGAGHDIILNNSTILARIYYKSLLDLTDTFDGLGKKYGGWIPAAKSPIEVEGKIYGIPMYYILLPMLWRKDLFEANGLKPPDTWELARVAARTLKPKGNPAGIAFSHCNDANLVWRSLMFSFGATEADPSGDNPTIDSKEMREALRFAKALFDEGMTPEVFSWDDASDNRFLASGIAGWIHDAISAYRTTESTNPTVFKNTYVGLEPAGPGGKRVHCVAPIVFLSWKFTKNAQGVKEYLTALTDADKDGMIASTGYNMPFLNDNAKKPMPILGADPKLQVLQDFPKIVAFFGYPGPYTPAIQEVALQFVLPDIFTRVARGQSIDDSMKWGVGEYRRIFSKHKKA
jgi:multiple sugar transport system substrate-binding protein